MTKNRRCADRRSSVGRDVSRAARGRILVGLLVHRGPDEPSVAAQADQCRTDEIRPPHPMVVPSIHQDRTKSDAVIASVVFES
ncbi:hypothetical protein [Streptomyces sp. NPDC085932]|uniref:hypothetical protein n=1 Tax=Streptomyces sp. NPDC085932 TaxID=3365741 RepID=UPI0037D5F715